MKKMSNFVIKQPEVSYETKTFRFPKALVERMASVAKENHVSVNELAKQAITYALDDCGGRRANNGRE
jgi:predicted HicB family RNase H-like nuclease